MKTNPFIKPSLVFAALFAVLAGAKSQANMIANGSFETAAPNRTYDQQPGWVSSGDTEFAPAATWSGYTATDGSQVVVLQGIRSSSSGIRTVSCDEPSWASISDSKTSMTRLKAGFTNPNKFHFGWP